MKINALLLGPIGTGKTYSLRTFLDVGIDVFVLSLEPGVAATLEETDEAHVHWHYIKPVSAPWDTLESFGEQLNLRGIDAAVKSAGAYDRQEYKQFLEVYQSCAKFKCDRCGKEFGAVDEWGEDRVFAVDGLTNLGKVAIQLLTGPRPIKSQPEWYAAQDLVENFIDKCVGDTKCNFVLISHIEKELDQIRGGHILTVSTLGRALAPKIPKKFDEVIFTRRQGHTFKWSTDDVDIDLKSRRLPISNDLEPTFAQIFKNVKKNGKKK